MISDTIEELVLDTLYFRRTNPDASCLQTNVAGQELEQHSVEALPVIENILANIVGPRISESEVNETFHGLSGLLGAYIIIGSRSDVTRTIHFLSTLPTPLQAKAVALVPMRFRKAKFRPQEKGTNQLKEPPSEQLLSFVKESTLSHDKTLQDNAAWALSFFSNRD
jgi:hypothetical protein